MRQSPHNKIEKKCICGKVFNAKPSQIRYGNGKYCSLQCASNANRKRVVRMCEMCGSIFETFPSRIKSGIGKYCSKECVKKHMKTRYKGKLNPNYRGGKVKRICLLCNSEFFVVPAQLRRLDRNEGNFCSQKCRAIWNLKHNLKFKDTKIEKLIEDELTERHISHAKQFPVEGIALVDFFLLNKIIIQCDGDYWHNIQKNKNRDIQQDFLFNFKGYLVFRFTEKEIHKSPQKCIDKVIMEAIKEKFISNEDDLSKIDEADEQQTIAEAISEGIEAWA